VTVTNEIPSWPFPRANVLDIAADFRALRADDAVFKVRTPGGGVAWMVTRHQDVKRLYADERLGWSHPDPEATFSATVGAPSREHEPGKPGEGRKDRVPLTHSFGQSRMRSLQAHIKDFVDELIDGVAAMDGQADLHAALSFPLPARVVCELLGVPYDDRDQFRDWSLAAANWADREGAAAAMEAFTGYMRGLIERKRHAPSSDMISDLIEAQADGRLADDEIARVAIGLLFAGHQTTVARIDLGILLLLRNPAELAALRADPGLVDGAVEEILRMASPNGGGGLPRFAHADIEVGGTTIKAGDQVLMAASVANRDETVFSDPDTFQIHRKPNPHLTFGHGPRFCCGAGVARMELQAVFSTLFQRLPTLRLALPLEEIVPRGEQVLGGVTALPVTW
jgi:cytochrome P450